MTREEKQKAIDALKISAPVIAVTQEEFNDYIQTLNKIMDWLEQEPLCDKLTREYISKVKCCDECFASTFCTLNGLRESRVPQDYCIENIKKYFEDKASLTGAESEAME